MSDTPKPSIREQPSVEATFLNARLVSETVTSAPGRMAPPNTRTAVQVNTETSSNFSLGVDNATNPTIFLVQIAYKVVHKAQEGNRELVKYESGHEAQFRVLGKSGFNDWLSPPMAALAPYLSVVQGIAMKRAEHTFIDMGFIGVALPVPTEFAAPAVAQLPKSPATPSVV